MKQETQQQTASTTTSQKVVSQQAQKSSASAIDKLKEFGGFAFLENIIDGYSNLNPARKARRNIFLTDEQWENERKALVNRLSVWLKLLRENDTAEQMRDKAKETAENAENLLNHNLKNALARTRELESAYRTIAFFYKNTESDKVKNVTIVNATMEQLQDLDNTIFADHISNELKQNFDRLDLRRNYSLLVVPGYIGSNAILDKWSKMAYENKVFLVTDFQDLETPDDVVDIFFNANHTSGDVFKSNTIMTCNWLLGRQREESVGEEENLYIPPSSSLAGKIYNTLMSQVVAGKKFGGLNEVESVRFDLRKSEISELERMGLVPMVNEYSKVMAFSAKTLFNGDNLGLQTYSVVRVFDYITKVLIDFLNRRAFENWTTRTEADLRGQVVKFLDSVMGPNKLIERFKVMKIEQDPNQKDRVLLDIHITPYFPAKSFVIQLAGHKGDNPEDAIWESEYHQLFYEESPTSHSCGAGLSHLDLIKNLYQQQFISFSTNQNQRLFNLNLASCLLHVLLNLRKVDCEHTIADVSCNLLLVDIIRQEKCLLELGVRELAAQIMLLLILILLLVLLLHLDVQIAVGIDVDVEVVLLHSGCCKLYCIIVFCLFNIYSWGGCVSTRHKVGIKKVVENFWHPCISHYW